MENKFFNVKDKKFDALGEFKIPNSWWSRPYEYYFASQYLNENDIIIDAGCGIEHPFKWWAKDRVKMVHAIDIDPRIKEFDEAPRINFWNVALDKIKGHLTNVDKVFCISVFEHLAPEIQHAAIENFWAALKHEGKLIMTVDFPLLKPEILMCMFDSKKWRIGKTKYEESKDNLFSTVYKLKCYSLVATKKGGKRNETNN
jgi:2-polyprenyl-3-methyl-5-hydroxy-6-metoxy-1,4-benzoquinol methylase